MIKLYGNTSGREFDAAQKIRELIVKWKPQLLHSKDDDIKIFCGFKNWNSIKKDIDIILVANFKEKLNFNPEFNFEDRETGKFKRPIQCFVKNIICAIEVKGVSSPGVVFSGTNVSVRRDNNELEDVTDQNLQQAINLKKLLIRKYLDNNASIFVTGLIYLTELNENELPKRPHNIFGADANFSKILNVISHASTTKISDNNLYLQSSSNSENIKSILDENKSNTDWITRSPTGLDRRKMDQISKSEFDKEILKYLGKKQVILKGRGGVGKTVILLQMAYNLWLRERKRSLVLSYNKALVADIRRTMCLLDMPRNLDGGIEVKTIHSFLWYLFKSLGYHHEDDDYLETYEDKKNELVEFLSSETLTKDELDNIINNHREEFYYDYIFVDEAQDWPQNEINILQSLYDYTQVIVADGEDQYIRGKQANWVQFGENKLFKPKKLNKCIRMKKSLTIFVNALAEKLDLSGWDLIPSDKALGGRVIVYEGDLYKKTDIISEHISEAKENKNYPLDLLMCVPPKFSKLQESLAFNQIKYWDGTDDILRSEPCFDRESIRIVQYDSCRGLEGWTTFNFELDTFWDYKFNLEKNNFKDFENFQTPEEQAYEMTAKWILIPLTRSMDTIVINLTEKDSQIKTFLKQLKDEYDFIHWNKI